MVITLLIAVLVLVALVIAVVVIALNQMTRMSNDNAHTLLAAHELWGRFFTPPAGDPSRDADELQDVIRNALELHLPDLVGDVEQADPPWTDDVDPEHLPERSTVAYLRPGEPIAPGLEREDPPFNLEGLS